MSDYSGDDEYAKLHDLVTGDDDRDGNLQEDIKDFFDKGNKAAGTRARKGLQKIRNLALDMRKEIQRIKNEEL
jgi:hypothetical protein